MTAIHDRSRVQAPLSARVLVRRVSAATCLAGAVVVGALPIGPLPPLGHLLDPIYGVWAVARGAELPRSATARIPTLGAPVDVRYDSRDVPHIFAASEADAYRALGFVVARDRLFQMELQVRAGAGTLSELIGPAGIPLDREMRHLGLPAAADRAFARLDTASAVGRVLRAYADGVNAFIHAMGPAELPIEYRLLDRQPTLWAPVDAFYLLNRMSLTLASSDPELERLRLAALVGDTIARVLLPLHSPLQQPIVPTGHAEAHFLTASLPPLGPRPSAHDTDTATAFDGASLGEMDGTGSLGSNNWAVAPRRTRSGFALLAGDPHLDLTLPSIWYEVHLVVPGQLDVAGVTISGGPAVIIGFTRDLAWSFTNTGADVLDLYAETVDDVAHPHRYRLDGSWRDVTQRVERYRGPRGALLATDTVLSTHRGPLRRIGQRWYSMRWTALEAGAALPALLAAPHAHSTAEWLRAMASYDVPAQNMLVADRTGSIAIRSTGRYPVRPDDGRGDVIRDGSTSASDWRGAQPLERYPTAVDPAQGFLASANQEPIDPSAVGGPTPPPYLGAIWPSPWRAIHINALLRADSSVTADELRRWQTDPGSARADFFLPYFLTAAMREENRVGAPPSLREAARLLSDWDGRYTRANERAVLFEAAMHELAQRVGDAIAPSLASRRGPWLPTTVLAELLHDSTSSWWPELARRAGVDRLVAGPSAQARSTRPSHGLPTDATAARDAMLAASVAAAYDTTVRRHGQPDGGGWRWDKIQQANIYHLLRVPAFSRLHLPIRGGPETLNPSTGTGTQGASWRMVVQLTPDVRAWAVYPGGQSGNPVSARYADRLPLWLSGSLDPVRFPRQASDLAPGDLRSVLTLRPPK